MPPSTWSEWTWWIFSVLFAGLVVSVIASYVVRLIDSWWSTRQDRLEIRSKAESEEVDRTVLLMLNDAGMVAAVFSRWVELSAALRYDALGGLILLTAGLLSGLGVLQLTVQSTPIAMSGQVQVLLLVLLAGVGFTFLAATLYLSFNLQSMLRSREYRLLRAATRNYKRKKRTEFLLLEAGIVEVNKD